MCLSPVFLFENFIGRCLVLSKNKSASKRAMSELFSNSESVPHSEKQGGGGIDRRAALKLELFGESSGTSSEKSEPKKAQERRSVDVEKKRTEAERVAAAPLQSSGTSSKREPVQRNGREAAVERNRSQGTVRREGAARETEERRVSDPGAEKRRLPNAATENRRVQTPETERARAVRPQALEVRNSVKREPEKRETVKKEPEKIEAAKKRQPAKKKTGRGKAAAIIGSCFGIVAAIAAAVIAIYISTREEPFIPADILAGYEDRSASKVSVISDTALSYLTNDRYDVKFTFYEAPDIVCNTSEISVGELMEKMGVVCGEDNRMAESPDDIISSDAVIDIKTLSYETAYTTESVAYDTEYIDIRTIPKGTTQVKQNGKNGVKTYTYTCTLVNGVEESRELVGERITENPTSRVLYRGVGGTVTSGGKVYNYSYYIDVQATSYNIVGTTASGLPTSTSVMAVDPRVIPLGTRCVVVGGGDYGYRIAADTGGDIKGNKIDLWYPAGTFSGFGWRSTRVYILD